MGSYHLLRPLHKTFSRSLPLKSKISQPSSSGLAYRYLGEWVICFSRGEMSSFAPQCVTCRRLDTDGIPIPSRSWSAPCPWYALGHPGALRQGIGVETCMRCLWCEYACLAHTDKRVCFLPIAGTSFSGPHIVKAALEADVIIFAPHALPDVDCSESQFLLHMLMVLVKERYSLSIAQHHEMQQGIYYFCFP